MSKAHLSSSSSSSATRALFVTWDGVAQNYMQSLFFPIFAHAQQVDRERSPLDIQILQFTWAPDAQLAQIRQSARTHGLVYHHEPTLQRPKQLAVPAMILWGARRVLQVAHAQKIDVLMPRSIIPAAMCLLAKRFDPSLRIVFDADGLMADERVDFSGWRPGGVMYRLFRDWEAQAIRASEAVITRSSHAKKTLLARAGAGTPSSRIHVLPNAKDDALFTLLSKKERSAVRDELGVPHDATLIAYAGSLGPQYHPAEMIELFTSVHARDPKAHMLLMSGMPDVVAPLLAKLPDEIANRVILKTCAPAEVARFLAASDVGLSLREPTFSQQAVCPIKVVEYMLCGLPTVMIRGVGDLDDRFEDLAGLHVLEDVTPPSLDACAAWCVEMAHTTTSTAKTLRERAISEFGIGPISAKLHTLLTSSTNKTPTHTKP